MRLARTEVSLIGKVDNQTKKHAFCVQERRASIELRWTCKFGKERTMECGGVVVKENLQQGSIRIYTIDCVNPYTRSSPMMHMVLDVPYPCRALGV
jgi:hypothetical protein